MFFFLIVGLLAMKVDRSHGKENASSPQSSDLLADIRRQLMKDNYDYLPTESEEEFPLNRQANDHRSPENTAVDYDYHANDKQKPKVPNKIRPRVYEEDQIKEDDVSKKDLYYYINDERMGLVNNDFYEDNNEYKNGSNTRVKYKIIKIRPASPNRRSLTARRFIEERGQDGVAIMNLDDQPFPEFRLPKSRRQYMQETSDNDNNDEVANFAEDFSFEDAEN